MSSGSQVAVLGRRGRGRSAVAGVPARGRPRLTLAAFAAFGTYGMLRWGTMLAGEPAWRLLGLVAVAVAVAALGELAHSRRRGLQAAAIVAIALGALAVIPLSGFPLHYVTELKLARTAHAISDGLANLPSVIVPYDGPDQWTRAVIVLGAGLLLLAGGLELASSRRPHGAVRLACVALAVTVLAIVPSSLARPHDAYLHGIVLFLLIAVLVLSERVPDRRGWPAAAVVMIAAITAWVLAPTLDRRVPWVSVQTLAGTIGPPAGEAFDWAQTYGPLDWPHTDTVVMSVRARYPAYWKAVDLDEFDGTGWAQAPVGGDEETAFEETVPAQTQKRWLQTLTVNLRDMRTHDVIAAGIAYPPTVGELQPGDTFGTFTSLRGLTAGDTYQVKVYAPQPSPTQLASAGTDYPIGDLTPELGMLLPVTRAGPNGPPAQPLQFEPYGSHQRLEGYAGLTSGEALQLLDASPYGPVYRLSQHLERGTRTPYQYEQAVMRYLASGFTYNLSPAPSTLPIISFLLDSKEGYCQQFAGAMALLLRMGGVPAHVSAGFATGTYDASLHAYEVSDTDAHAWVEAWFPGYGWVTFDPTASAETAAGQLPSINAGATLARTKTGSTAGHRQSGVGVVAGADRHAASRSSSAVSIGLAVAVLLALIGVLAVWMLRARRVASDPDRLLAELERAFARCGRPLTGAVSLAALERRYRSAPEAAGYIAAVRLARFAPEAPPATSAQRRALRRELRHGLGALGPLLALIALPPWSPGRDLH